MVGILVSFWDGLFSGAFAASFRVPIFFGHLQGPQTSTYNWMSWGPPCEVNIYDMSHEKNPPTFHYTGWLIGILIMVYYNPYITG